ncbi:MAG: S9 family peptidase [bacterium]|nr:S9 family peptidase [bacterium]
MTGIMLKDFMKYRFISNLQYAPEGKYAAFAVSSCSETQNYYDSCLWIWSEANKKISQLTSGDREQTYMWEDEEHILFAAYRKETEENRQELGWEFTPIYRIAMDGGEATKAFELPIVVRGLKRMDEQHLLVLGEIDAREPDLYKAVYLEKKSIWSQKRREEAYETLDESPFWKNGRGFVNKKRLALFLYDKEKGALTRISDGFLDTSSVTVLGKKVYYAGERYENKSSRRGEIWSYHVDTKKNTCVMPAGEYDVERLEAVGRDIFVFASDEKTYGINENPFLYRLDEKKGELQLLCRSQETIGNTVNSDCRYGVGREVEGREDGSLYLIATRRNASHLLHMKEKEAIWSFEPVIEKEGSIDAFALHPSKEKLLFIAMHDGRLQELYQWTPRGKIRKLSSFNETALQERKLSKMEKMSIVSSGEEIDGWVMKPTEFSEDRHYPAILQIHGGPKTVYGEVFFHEMQYFAGQQYFVFFCNPLGSDGRGNAFADIRGRYGSRDYQNLMDFTDEVLKRYPQIDAKRLAVSGGSYGGFMTNWIVGHTDRFACAISQRSISNWISLWGISDIGPYFVRDQMAGEMGEKIESFWRQSPLCYYQNVKTPTLFIHASEDYRCPVDQSIQFYTALVENKVPAKLFLIRGENHEMSRSGKPRHRVRRLVEMTNWLKRWLA